MVEKQVSVRLQAVGGGQLKAEFQAIGAEAQKSFGQITQGARAGGVGLDDVGQRVQAFVRQIDGGMDVSRALAQQVPMLLSGFGLLGVAMGTGVTVAMPFFSSLIDGADNAEELNTNVKELTESVKAYDAAAKAASATPLELFADFGGAAGQAKEVLEIQRQIAAARAENALGQASGSIASFLGGDANRIEAYRAQIRQMKAELEAVRNNPPLAVDFDFAAAEADIAKLQGRLDRMNAEVVENLSYSLDVSTDSAARIVEALGAVAEASDAAPRDQAAAMADLRQAIINAVSAGGQLSDETLLLMERLTDAELAALGLAAVDLAGPIGAGAAEAGVLATNLWDAAAAQAAFDRANATYSGRGGDPRQWMDGNAKPFVPSPEVVKQADAMLNPGPNRTGGGGGGSRISEVEREAARIYDQTRTAAEKYKIELAELNKLHASGHLDTETYNRAVAKLGEELNKTGDLGKQAASAIRSAFDNLFDDPKQALKDLAKQLAQMAIYQQLAKSLPNIFGGGGLIPLMNANGNAFDRGVVQAFASGGVVTGATMFPMRGGMGVMGEAGPEAIMPLTRVGGKLGVAAAGGGGGSNVQVNVVNKNGGEVTTSERRGPNGERILDVEISRSIGSGRQDKVLGRFGNRPTPVIR